MGPKWDQLSDLAPKVGPTIGPDPKVRKLMTGQPELLVRILRWANLVPRPTMSEMATIGANYGANHGAKYGAKYGAMYGT